MAGDNCTTCRYYVGHRFGGWCRRHAPVRIEPQNGVERSAFPSVSGESHWCGDHECAAAALDAGRMDGEKAP